VERRVEYAIMGSGKNYAEQAGKENISDSKTIYSLINNPVYTTTAFEYRQFRLIYSSNSYFQQYHHNLFDWGGGVGAL